MINQTILQSLIQAIWNFKQYSNPFSNKYDKSNNITIFNSRNMIFQIIFLSLIQEIW